MGLLNKRRQAVELQDLSWFPSVIRDGITDYLQFTITMLNLYAPAETVVLDLLKRNKTSAVIDLCSGGAGPHLLLQQRLSEASGQTVSVTLTDKFPNLAAFQTLEKSSRGAIKHLPFSVDARHVPLDLPGVRTLFTSFHHFADQDARAILQNAFEQRRPIAVFEFTERTWLSLLVVFPTPLWMLLFTPLLWPWKWSRFFWTYLIPVIPFVTWWDVVVSVFRTRNPQEMLELTAEFKAQDYQWRSGKLRSTLGLNILYLTGSPKEGYQS